MAAPQQKSSSTTAVDKKQDNKQSREPRNDVYHVRLRGAGMFKDDLSKLNLNALSGKSSGTVSRDTPKENLVRLRQAITLGRVEIYDPTLPDMTEPKPTPRKDLTKTNEYKVICHPNDDEILRFIGMVKDKGPKGVLSLKIMHSLETGGDNPILKPRADIVNALEDALKELGIDNPKLTKVEVDRILVLHDTPEEIMLSMQ
jgi:hypothetical protein